MQKNSTAGRHAAPKKALGTPVKIILLVLSAGLLALLGFRLHSWMEQRGEPRLMVLVNPWNNVDNSGFSPKLKTVEGVQVDKSCAEDLQQLLADCRAEGCPITLTAGYRTREDQLTLFNNEVDRQMMNGRSADTAYTLAEQRVGAPGTSEHELGLAIDVQGVNAQNWMKENAWRYGFILRYPAGSEQITGRSADTAHYRYVGLTAAEQIHSLDITLEEYMGMFYTQDAEIIIES